MHFQCPSCSSKFTRKRNLKKHYITKHSSDSNSDIGVVCFLCGQMFRNIEKLNEHNERYHRPSTFFEVRESAFQKAAVSYRLIYDAKNMLTPAEAQNDNVRNEIRKVIFHEISQKNVVKFCIVFIAEMVMLDNDNKISTSASIPFRSKTYTASGIDKENVKKKIESAMIEQSNRIEDFINNGSNWIFKSAIAMDVEVGGINPIYAGSDTDFLKFNVRKIKNQKYLINVPSKDNKCFLYCITEFLYGSHIINKFSHEEYEKYTGSFNIRDINFPISIKHVKKFVKQNEKLDIKLNIIYLSGKEIFPLECGIGEGSKTVNLLMIPIEDDDGVNVNHHFVLIKNIDKFLSKTYDTGKHRKFYENAFFCPNCFSKFTKNDTREKHLKTCISQKAQIEKAPDDNNDKIFFRKHENQFEQDLIAYLDFECELPKVDDRCERCHTVRCKCDTSYTRFETEQKPISFAFYIINKDNEILEEKKYTGPDAAEVFIEYLFQIEKTWLIAYLNKNIPMKELTSEEVIMYEESDVCYICKRAFSEDDPKVRDHDHSDGLFISAAHNSCNLKRKNQKSLKIFMHNGSKYDFHFLVKAISKKNVKNLYVLPYNMEHFRMIKFNSFTLLDSLAFLQSSLSQLAEELKDSNHDYPILRQSDIVKTKGYFDKEKFEMVLQKGFFPYEYW